MGLPGKIVAVPPSVGRPASPLAAVPLHLGLLPLESAASVHKRLLALVPLLEPLPVHKRLLAVLSMPPRHPKEMVPFAVAQLEPLVAAALLEPAATVEVRLGPSQFGLAPLRLALLLAAQAMPVLLAEQAMLLVAQAEPLVVQAMPASVPLVAAAPEAWQPAFGPSLPAPAQLATAQPRAAPGLAAVARLARLVPAAVAPAAPVQHRQSIAASVGLERPRQGIAAQQPAGQSWPQELVVRQEVPLGPLGPRARAPRSL